MEGQGGGSGGKGSGWEALGKAVLAETEPRSVAEPNVMSANPASLDREMGNFWFLCGRRPENFNRLFALTLSSLAEF